MIQTSWSMCKSENFLFLFQGFFQAKHFPSLSAVGFAELEYGMLRLMGAVDDDTPVSLSKRGERSIMQRHA